MNTYSVSIQMESDRRSMDVVQKHLDRVKAAASREGFELVEVHTRSLTSGEEELERK